jgi:hypothetical protein
MTYADAMAPAQVAKTDAERLAALVEEILRVVPYVTATVAPWSHEEVYPNWIAIHKGRANSSYNQLENLRNLAESLRRTLR